MDIVAYSTLHMDRQHQLLNELQEAVRSTAAFARAQRAAIIRLFHSGRSAHPLPDERPDLFLFRRIRPHDSGQFVARYLELTHKIPAYIGGGKRAFEMMRNHIISFIDTGSPLT